MLPIRNVFKIIHPPKRLPCRGLDIWGTNLLQVSIGEGFWGIKAQLRTHATIYSLEVSLCFTSEMISHDTGLSSQLKIVGKYAPFVF